MCFKALNGPFRLGVQMRFYLRVEQTQGLCWRRKEFFKLNWKKKRGKRKFPAPGPLRRGGSENKVVFFSIRPHVSFLKGAWPTQAFQVPSCRGWSALCSPRPGACCVVIPHLPHCTDEKTEATVVASSSQGPYTSLTKHHRDKTNRTVLAPSSQGQKFKFKGPRAFGSF